MAWSQTLTTNTMCLIIILISGLQSLVRAVSVNEEIPLDKGNHYRVHWFVNACMGGVGIFLNSITLFTMLSLEQTHRVHFYRLNLCIILSDLLNSGVLLAFPVADLNHGGLFGGFFCNGQSMAVLMSIGITMFSIAGMSFVAKYDICNDIKLSPIQMNVGILCGFVFLSGIALFVQFVPPPYGGNKLDYSGLYCFVDWKAKVTTPIAYFVLVFLPLGFVCYNVYITYITVKRAQELLLSHGINEQAKGQYIKMVLKMFYFVIATGLCYSTSMILTLYEIFSNQYFPVLGSAISEDLASSLQCFVNPALFFYLNHDLRDKFREIASPLIILVSSISKKCGFNGRWSVGILYSMQNTRTLGRVSVVCHLQTDDTKIVLNYKDIEVWLAHEALRKLFEDHCRSEYVMENLLFVMYVREYMAAINKINELANIDSRIETWQSLADSGKKIFTLFIQPQVAPLEINIPHDMRNRVIAQLTLGKGLSKKINGSDISCCNDIEYPPYSENIVDEFAHVYDECLDCILTILNTDIWPRFVKSSLFRKGVEIHSDILV